MLTSQKELEVSSVEIESKVVSIHGLGVSSAKNVLLNVSVGIGRSTQPGRERELGREFRGVRDELGVLRGLRERGEFRRLLFSDAWEARWHDFVHNRFVRVVHYHWIFVVFDVVVRLRVF